MNGVLLDRTTGKPTRRASVPESGEVAEWRRAQAEKDVKEQLQLARRFPGMLGTTTTNRYLSSPAAAAGVNITTGAGVFTFSAWNQMIAASAVTVTFYLVAIVFQPAPASALATTNEYLVEIGTGAAAAEVTQVQLPFTVRNVTAAGYIPPAWLSVPEPVQVAANARVSVRVAASVASLATTAHKLVYARA